MKTQINIDLKKIIINRDLCVGLFILGVLAHYTKEEMLQYKDISYIASTLTKKHFNIKNGDENIRMWNNINYVQTKIKETKGRINLLERVKIRHEKAIISYANIRNNWTAHTHIANEAWKRAADFFSSDNAITTTQLIIALLRKSESTKKYYKYNDKKLDKFSKTGMYVGTHIFSSSRVATKLLSTLDEEIAHFQFNNKE